MKMNPVVHFEMPAEDRKRVSDFYSSVFGWNMNELSGEMGSYILATTTESDDKGPKNPGAINGGFFSNLKDQADHVPSVVISVDDYKAHMEKVTAGGGTILGEPMEIPGIGTYVSFRDTEGNRVGMLQPSSPM